MFLFSMFNKTKVKAISYQKSECWHPYVVTCIHIMYMRKSNISVRDYEETHVHIQIYKQTIHTYMGE